MGFHGSLWDLMGFDGISCDFYLSGLMGFYGIVGDLMRFHGILCDLMGFNDDLPLVIQHSYGIDGPVVNYLPLKNEDFP